MSELLINRLGLISLGIITAVILAIVIAIFIFLLSVAKATYDDLEDGRQSDIKWVVGITFVMVFVIAVTIVLMTLLPSSVIKGR